MDIELKNWSKIYSSSFFKQFVEFDLLTMTKNNPKIWVFKKTKGIPDVETLQKKILEDLKKDDIKKKINSYFREDSEFDLKNELDIFDGEKSTLLMNYIKIIRKRTI
ncbi:MAG: hypothetical protein K5757_12970 [Bacteroidaceae bacterium]|nr:hypothetical protein [Bacteroidaceae bacterium]